MLLPSSDASVAHVPKTRQLGFGSGRAPHGEPQRVRDDSQSASIACKTAFARAQSRRRERRERPPVARIDDALLRDALHGRCILRKKCHCFTSP